MAAVPQQPPLQNAGDDTIAPKKTTTHSDPSAAIFSMYITRAQNFDEENVENWKGSAEGILVFTGLFSSTVATFIAMSYPNLQRDPNDVTHALLTQISQQLPNANTSGTGSTAGPSIQSPFVPPKSAVFINSAWFLSLVLSLTCALMATLLQQWGRRYLQIIQRNNAPHLRAHIHEYFSQGTRKFHIFGLVEVLLFLLLLSVILFFAGLVVFAFRANHVVASFTAAIVGLCILSYIAFTLMPFFRHDCPYQTPVTFILWYFAQIIPFAYFSAAYHAFNQMEKRWGTVKKSWVESFLKRQKSKAKSLSEGIVSGFEKSAKHISMDIYKNTLARTLDWLSEDNELEEFVTGIPGLFESKALSQALGTNDNGDTQRTYRGLLAALPGPTSFNPSLSWSVMHLAQRAVSSNPSDVVQRQRTQACIKALYYVPGAIRDVLVPYAVEKSHCSEILPLLNSPDSLKIIDELWGTSNVDIALSVRCVAAVVSSFMTTAPRPVQDNSVTPNVFFIGDDKTGRQFLAERLRVGASAGGVTPKYPPRSDSARLQNLVHFLGDVKGMLGLMSVDWWTSKNAASIRRERRSLFGEPSPEGHRTGRGMSDQQGDRASPAFVPAAQQDLVALTLEILAQDPVADATTPQREAFRRACEELRQEASTRAQSRAREEARALSTQAPVPEEEELELLARMQGQALDSIKMIENALKPVLQSLRLPIELMSAPQGASAAAAVTNSTDRKPVLRRAGSAHESSPIEGVPSLSQRAESSSSAWPPPSPATGGPDTSNMV